MTPIVAGQKTAFIAIVNVINPDEATLRLPTILNNYEDIPTVIGRQLPVFINNPAYLKEAIAVFAPNDADLVVAGVYVDKEDVPDPLSNPKLLINSKYTGTVALTQNSDGVCLLGKSEIKLLELSAGIKLRYLYMGAGSKISMVDSSADGARIDTMIITFAKSVPAEITEVAFESNVGQIFVSPGAIYGGQVNIDPELECASEATELAANSITHNSIALSWLPPATAYILMNVYYKNLESPTWLPVDADTGDYFEAEEGRKGFMFRQLEPDTHYQFKIVITCTNGGVKSSEVIDETTLCYNAVT